MTTSAPNLETLRLHLVWNKDFGFNPENRTVSMEELIEFLIGSVEEADKATINKAENLLTRIGRPAIPALVQGLKSQSTQIKSLCAMVLIRIGQPAVDSVSEFYVRSAARYQVRWVAAFILSELGAELPTVEVLPNVEHHEKVLQLSKVG